MRSVVSVLAGLVVTAAIVSALVVVPSPASAAEYSGVSPSFSPDTSWSLYLGYAGVGDIIEWYWTTSDSLSSCVVITPDMTYLYGYSSWDGLVVTTPGHYNLVWTNNNWFYSATVSYWAAVFTPSLSVTAPSEGAYLGSRTTSIQGATDPYADGVLVGPDSLHLREATWSGDNWGVDGYALSEGQNTILVRSYYLLDYYGYENITYDKTIHLVVDTAPPELAIVTPVPSAYLNGTVHLDCQYSDDSGIAKMETKIDAWSWQTVSTLEQDLDLAEGIHTVQVRVTDLAGNPTINTVTFTVDKTPPVATITSPIDGSCVHGIWWEWQCTDNNGIALEEINIDGAGWQEWSDSGIPVHLADGQHMLQVRATDVAGNTAVEEVEVAVDATPPQVTISPLDAKISKDNVLVTWVGTDATSGIDHYEVQLVGGSWVDVGNATSYQLTNLNDEWYVFAVKAVDQTGNEATAAVSFGIYTSVWSQNGPYQGIPLFGLITAIIIVVILATLLLRKRKGGPAVASVPKEEPAAQAP